MNADLKKELEESPELVPVVARLLAAREAGDKARQVKRGGVLQCSVCAFRPSALLLAASLLTGLVLTAWFVRVPTVRESAGTPVATYGAREYHLSPAEMIASQNADGSWQNDFLTRRNAEVLQSCETPAARIAYKKAMRNLRSRGIL